MYDVLIVEDEKLIRNSLQQAFDWKRMGFQVVGAVSDGCQALKYLDSRSVDVILSDIKMPEMDGIELMKRVKSHHPDIEFVLLTAYSDFEYAKKALAYGAFAYILKLDLMNEFELTMEKLYNRMEKTKLSRKIYDHIFKMIDNAVDKENGDPMKNAQQYILSHFSEPLNMEDIAELFHFSAAYFSRQFKQRFGYTFSEYLKKLRLETAYWLITTTNNSVTDVMYAVGYRDAKNFNSQFKEIYQITPIGLKNLRKSHQSPIKETRSTEK